MAMFKGRLCQQCHTNKTFNKSKVCGSCINPKLTKASTSNEPRIRILQSNNRVRCGGGYRILRGGLN